VNPYVRFEEEADAEYRAAGRWYEDHRRQLGVEFFDATIDQIVMLPDAGSPMPRMPADLSVRRRAVTRFPYHVVYLHTHGQTRILAIAHDRRKPGYWRERLK
jgi:toxin ParE1/3/4